MESDILLFGEKSDIMVFTNDDTWIRKEYPHVQTILTQSIIECPYSVKRMLDNIKKALQWRKYYRRADIFLFGGGTSMSDFPWHSLGQVLIAAFFGIPSVIWGAGYTPVNDEKSERFIRKILNRDMVKAIYVRDEKCKERLLDIGVSEQKIDYCYDSALCLEGESFCTGDYFTKEQECILENGRKNIVITLSGERDAQEKTDMGLLIKMTESLKNEYNIWLIPTGFLNGCHDTILLSVLARSVKETNLVTKEFRPRHLIEFLKRCDVVITSRLHMSIFAVCAGTPFIALERNDKNKDFADIMSLKCFSMLNLPVEMVLYEVRNIICNKDEYRQWIAEKREQLRKRNVSAVEAVHDILREC